VIKTLTEGEMSQIWSRISNLFANAGQPLFLNDPSHQNWVTQNLVTLNQWLAYPLVKFNQRFEQPSADVEQRKPLAYSCQV
jgi:hypothetical protein